jgi:hypothetical protein
MSAKKLTLKYLKTNKFNKNIFLSTAKINANTLLEVERLYNIIKGMKNIKSNPIYKFDKTLKNPDDAYIIRFVKNDKMKFDKSRIYEIEYKSFVYDDNYIIFDVINSEVKKMKIMVEIVL